MASYIWLGILILTVAVEIATTQLVTIWFAIGSLAALIVSLFLKDAYLIQAAVFVVISAVALAATRPLVKKYINKKNEPTNADMVIGKTAVVTEEINNNEAAGMVKVNGSVWTARSADGSVVKQGELVMVKEIQGVKLIVELR